MCSLQDSMGFLWFGTKDGLNRFDGYSFKIFRRTKNKPGSIGNNFVHALYEGENGKLWIGTEKGLYKYDAVTEAFTIIPGTEKLGVSEITSDRQGTFWFLSDVTLFKYVDSVNKLEAYKPSPYMAITAICTTPDGRLWVATSGGQLQLYNPVTNRFTGFDLFDAAVPVPARWIERITPAGNGYILIGTGVAGTKIFDSNKSEWRDITVDENRKDLFVRNFLQTSANEFWIGTEHGVYIYNTQSGKSVNLSKKYNDPFAISDNAVYSFCRDREGGIWVGTYFGGINYYPNQFTAFKKYFPKIGENSLSGNIAREIEEDANGNLWIGTEDAGLNKLEKSTGRFTHYKPGEGKGSITYSNIHGLLFYENELWVGTFEHGLDVLDTRTGKVIRHYDRNSARGLQSNFVYCISESATGKIMIGTTIGAYYYNREKDYFDTMPGMPLYNWYTSLLEDANGVIWASTYGNGVNYYNTKTKERGNYTYVQGDPHSLSSVRVNSIYEDSEQRLWVATEDGLCKWDPSINGFIQYNSSHGFPGNFIISLLEDDNKNLWVSTTRGLVCFNPATEKVQVYSLSHGLLTDQFNFNSAYKDATGRMYFGSTKGLISFQPKNFNQNKFVPPVYITGLQVNNREIHTADSGSLLKKSVSFTAAITLRHNQSTFSLDFAALSFTAPEMLEYAYRLEGLSTDWTYLKGNRKVYFTELPPGTYTFIVKAANSSGTWSDKEARLTIEIRPPWWASPWAYFIYTVILLLLVFYSIRSYHLRVEEKNKRKIELLEIAKEKEVLQAKIEFFTNVAHEIKTPLTLIKVPLAKVIKKTMGVVPDVENSLRIMDKNTNRLIELTQQLLDFRQTEINQFRLSFVKTNISALLTDANKSFASLADQKNSRLTLHMPANDLYAYVDAEAFNKIIYNLYSNAVKYAATAAQVELCAWQENGSFTILFKNDGPIIPPHLSDKIFQPFFRIKKNDHQNGTGIGLALSLSLAQLHKGYLQLEKPQKDMNVFALTLPIHQETEFNLETTIKNNFTTTTNNTTDS